LTFHKAGGLATNGAKFHFSFAILTGLLNRRAFPAGLEATALRQPRWPTLQFSQAPYAGADFVAEFHFQFSAFGLRCREIY
jgi:hypothetical protein